MKHSGTKGNPGEKYTVTGIGDMAFNHGTKAGEPGSGKTVEGAMKHVVTGRLPSDGAPRRSKGRGRASKGGMSY